MSAPKSVTKVTKNGIEFTSNVDQCSYYLFELSRAALRDVAKFVRKRFRESYYENFKKHSGDAGKATSSVVLSGKDTKYPRVEIGLKKGKVDGFYAFFQEFGAKEDKIPKLGLLQKTVENNVAEIVRIESQYLSGLNGEASRLQALIDEGEHTDDSDED